MFEEKGDFYRIHPREEFCYCYFRRINIDMALFCWKLLTDLPLTVFIR